jgi:hypothetical protein
MGAADQRGGRGRELTLVLIKALPCLKPQVHRSTEENMQIPGITSFERRRQPLISRRRFADRMLRAVGLWCILAIVGLAIGMAGYAAFEDMSLADAYVNAAMILSGMGPMGELKTTPGKVFAGSYAIFSGLLIVIATGFVLAPIFHRLLHHFHVEAHQQD